MGDLVLTEAEVNPVMSSLAESGIEITALHNHLLRAQPATMYMHVEGHGDAVKLAQALRLALEQSETPVAFQPAAGDAKEPTLDTAALERILGHQGKANGGVYQFTIPRAEAINGRRHGGAPCDGHRHRHQLPAAGRRQGGHDRRLRPDRRRGEPGAPRPACSTASR